MRCVPDAPYDAPIGAEARDACRCFGDIRFDDSFRHPGAIRITNFDAPL